MEESSGIITVVCFSSQSWKLQTEQKTCLVNLFSNETNISSNCFRVLDTLFPFRNVTSTVRYCAAIVINRCPNLSFFHRAFIWDLFLRLHLQAETQHYALCKKFLVTTILTKLKLYTRKQNQMFSEFRTFCVSIRKLSTTSEIRPGKITRLSYWFSQANTGWFKKMDSISYVCISLTIHGMWMTYITFERGCPKFSNTTARALA